MILIVISGLCAALILFGVSYWQRGKAVIAMSFTTGGIFAILLTAMLLVSAAADQIMLMRFQILMEEIQQQMQKSTNTKKDILTYDYHSRQKPFNHS